MDGPRKLAETEEEKKQLESIDKLCEFKDSVGGGGFLGSLGKILGCNMKSSDGRKLRIGI